jgi:hypothetical protein
MPANGKPVAEPRWKPPGFAFSAGMNIRERIRRDAKRA